MAKASALTNTKSPKIKDSVDFCVDTCGPLVMFLPASSAAETWALTGGLGGNCKWLGVYLLEPDQASTLIQKMIGANMRVRIDGRVVC
jgi:hypothetical protein